MIRSMTGFGKAADALNGDEVVAEVSSVNHRYLDCSVRLPNGWHALEPMVRETVKQRLSRGKIFVTITCNKGAESPASVRFDRAAAEQYVNASKELEQLAGVQGTLSVDVLAQLEGVFSQEEPEQDLDKAGATVRGVLDKALAALDAMRLTEGAALADECRQRVGALRQTLTSIEARLPAIETAYEARLRQRLAELTAEVSITEERLAVELALLADKGDVTEEVVRLKAHMDHMLELLEAGEPVGRSLNFLAQELQREANTLGAKCRDTDVAKEVLTIKTELEKIREQVQNIE